MGEQMQASRPLGGGQLTQSHVVMTPVWKMGQPLRTKHLHFQKFPAAALFIFPRVNFPGFKERGPPNRSLVGFATGHVFLLTARNGIREEGREGVLFRVGHKLLPNHRGTASDHNYRQNFTAYSVRVQLIPGVGHPRAPELPSASREAAWCSGGKAWKPKSLLLSGCEGP